MAKSHVLETHKHTHDSAYARTVHSNPKEACQRGGMPTYTVIMARCSWGHAELQMPCKLTQHRHPNITTAALHLPQLLRIGSGVGPLEAQQVVKVSRHVLFEDGIRIPEQFVGLSPRQRVLFLKALDAYPQLFRHNPGRGICRNMTTDALAVYPCLEKGFTACRPLMDHHTHVTRNNKKMTGLITCQLPNILDLQLLCKPLCSFQLSIEAIPPDPVRLVLDKPLVLSPPVQRLRNPDKTAMANNHVR